MATDIDVLKAELLAGHPITGAYSSGAGQAADEVNALNVPSTEASTSEGLRVWAAGSTRMFRIHDAIGSVQESDEGRTAAILIDKILSHPANSFGDESVVDLVDDLVAEGILLAADKDALTSSEATFTSRSIILGLGEVGPGHVAEARKL